ncbi:hypothetical protein WH96_20650, partial [Kiloniella spongiae]
HPNENSHNETIKLNLNYFVTDDEGDKSNIARVEVQFRDDGPTIESDNAQVVIDDDNVPGADGNPGGVGDDAPANTTGTLSHNYGADEEGATTLLLDTGAPAGFTYELNDDGTLLTVKQDGVSVMTVSLDDTTSGNYTVTQLNPIKHPEGSDENNVEFVFNYRVTDGDKDTVDGTLAVSVDDDTPVAHSDVIKIDETPGFPQIFSTDEVFPWQVPSEAKVPGEQALSAAKERLSFDFGADSDGAKVGLTDSNGAEFDGADSGLKDAATDSVIYLYSVDEDTVEGRVGGEDGPVAFKAYLDQNGSSDSASVYFVQYRGIEHPNTNSHDEDINLNTLFYTVTDGDGDTATAKLRVNIDDDGPRTRFEYAGEIDEDTLVDDIDDNSSVDGKLRIDFGADGGKVSGISFLGWVDAEDFDPAGNTLFSNGVAVVFAAATVVGDDLVYIGSAGSEEIIRVEINQATGEYEIKLSGPVDHPDISLDADSNDYDPIDLGFRYTVTDNDGDRSSNFLVVTIEDDEVDSRSVRAREDNRSEWKVIDEATLDDNIADNSSVSGVLEFGFGADGGYLDDIYFKETKDTEHDDEAPEDTLTSGGDDVDFGPATDDGAGNMVLVGKNSVTGEEVIVVTINKTTGAYTVELKAPIDHEDTGSGNDNGDPLTIGFRYVTYDNDGDQDISRLEIVIEDDVIVGSDADTLSFDEDDLADGSSPNAGKLIKTGSFVDSVDFGADGFAGVEEVQFDGNTYTANGSGLIIVNMGAVTLTVTAATGAYSAELTGTHDHAGNGQDLADLPQVTAVLADGDGDTTTSTLDVSIKDDVAKAKGIDMGGGNVQEVSPDVFDGNVFAEGAKAGADGATVTGANVLSAKNRNEAANNNSDGNVTLTSAGDNVNVVKAVDGDGNITFTATTVLGSVLVYTMTIKTDGDYSFQQFAPIDHPDVGETGSDDVVRLRFKYELTDGDGDTSSKNLVIDIADGGPTAASDSGDVNEGETLTVVGVNNGVLSNDHSGPDGFFVSGVVAGDGTPVALGAPIQTAYGTLTLNSDGSYTYAAKADVTDTDLIDSFTYEVTDVDGDKTTAKLDINVTAVTEGGGGGVGDDDTIDFVPGTIIDGGDGIDTVTLPDHSGNVSYWIDPESAAGTTHFDTDLISNIEIIDMRNAGSGFEDFGTLGSGVGSLSVDDVIDMTDDNNELTILRDGANDTVNREPGWAADGTVERGGVIYDVYRGTGDDGVTEATLFVEHF